MSAVVVKPSYGLTDAEISRMLRDSFEHARDDMQVRALEEARVDGERLLEAVRAALAADAALLDAEELAAIERAAAALRGALPASDHRAIKAAAEALNRATDVFAGRRMDASVRRALAGQKIANFDA